MILIVFVLIFLFCCLGLGGLGGLGGHLDHRVVNLGRLDR